MCMYMIMHVIFVLQYFLQLYTCILSNLSIDPSDAGLVILLYLIISAIVLSELLCRYDNASIIIITVTVALYICCKKILALVMLVIIKVIVHVTITVVTVILKTFLPRLIGRNLTFPTPNFGNLFQSNLSQNEGASGSSNQSKTICEYLIGFTDVHAHVHCNYSFGKN